MSDFHTHDGVDPNDVDYFVQFEVVCFVEQFNSGSDITGNMLLQTLVNEGLLSAEVAIFSQVTGQAFPVVDGNSYILFTVRSPLIDVPQIYSSFYESYDNGVGIIFEEQLIGRVRHITPNWFVGAAYHTGLGAHGPGGPPRPIVNPKKLKNLRFEFSPSMMSEIGPDSGADCDEVVVYILDTIPDPCRIKSATRRWPLLKRPFAKILDEKARTCCSGIYETARATYHYADDVGCDLSKIYVHEHRSHELVLQDQHRLSNQLVLNHPYALGVHHYDSSDHGLFIAGIVHMIAPRVKIHVLEVMGFNGIGTFTSFAAGYRKVVELHQEYRKCNPNARAIINSSFTLAIPIGDHQNEGSTRMDALGASGKKPESRQIQDYINNAPQQVVAQLDDLVGALNRTLLIVGGEVAASSGNDSHLDITSEPWKESRYPAQYENVTGVGALKRDLTTTATYSNKPDQPLTDGYMVFGGDYDDNAQMIDGDYVDSGEGIIGIFTGNLNIDKDPYHTKAARQRIDPDRFENPYGFAEWKGTSFATPVLVGTVALLCCAKGVNVKDALQIIKDNSMAYGLTDEKRFKFDKVIQTHD